MTKQTKKAIGTCVKYAFAMAIIYGIIWTMAAVTPLVENWQ